MNRPGPDHGLVRRLPPDGMADRERRIKWVFGLRRDVLDDIDVALLDPENPDDRHLLIASEHPQMRPRRTHHPERRRR